MYIEAQTQNLIRASMYHENDFPKDIGAFPSEIGLTAPMPWGETVSTMNTRRDQRRYRNRLNHAPNLRPQTLSP